jgi:hypothetical protein
VAWEQWYDLDHIFAEKMEIVVQKIGFRGKRHFLAKIAEFSRKNGDSM